MGSTAELKKRNVSDVLRTIHQSGAISKNKIAQQLGLSPVTAHNLVNELSERGLVAQSGDSVSTGGRNAVLYRINGAFGHILGQTLSRRQLVTTVYDLSLTQKYQVNAQIDMRDQAACVRGMCEQLSRAITSLPGARFLGAGVSLPGRSDANGVVMQVPDMAAWRHIPLRASLEEQIALPVCVDNDVNALALSARWNGLSSRFSCAVYLDISEGVGTGILMDDRLFRGSYGYGCEIGHTSIMLGGPVCGCGNRGCLEAFIGGAAVLSRVNAARADAGQPPFSQFEDALACVRHKSDPLVLDALRRTVRYVAIAVEHIIRNFDPQAIILRCDWISMLPGLFEQLRDMVFTDFSWLRQDRFSLLLDDNPEVLTSAPACLFIQNFYANGAV